MWIYTKPRNEHDNRFLLNMALCSRVSVNQLGDRWFIEVTLGTEAVPVAATGSREQALALVRRIYEGIRSGEQAMDLGDLPEPMEVPRGRRGEPVAAR